MLSKTTWKDTPKIGPSGQLRMKKILNIIKAHNAAGAFIEVGCGTGHLLKMIDDTNRFTSIKGCDFSKEAVIISEGENFETFQFDLAEGDPAKYGQFDVVVCSEVLEHIEDDAIATVNLNKLLSDGGLLIISVPFGMKNWTKHDDYAGHVRRYEENELEEKLESAGFKIESKEVWGAFFYEIYYKYFLSKASPEKIMNLSTPFKRNLKAVLGKIVSFVLKFDNLLAFTNKGRRLFIVAIKDVATKD